MRKQIRVRKQGRSAGTITRASILILVLALLTTVAAVPALAAGEPVIGNLIPPRGPVGTTVLIQGNHFGELEKTSSLTFNDVKAHPTNWTDNAIITPVPSGAKTGPVVVTTEDGTSNTDEIFTVTTTPANAPQITSLIPTLGPAGTPVSINGSNFGTVDGTVTFNGVPSTTILAWTDTYILALVPAGASTGPVVVTTALGSSNGVTFTVTGGPAPPAQTWYLAEGCTAYGFETYVLIANTTATDASVSIVYNTSLGRIPRPTSIAVPANSRVTIRLNDEVPNVSVSTTLAASVPVVCERAMYWNDRIEGTDSIGVTSAGKSWYLAEGSTANGFETWVLIQNPGTATATVNVTYMTSGGAIKKQPFTVAGGDRYTVEVAKDVVDPDVSTLVESDQDIIAERSMYWDNRRGGHDSIGVMKGSKTWDLAEGSTAWGYQTWLLLQNPGDKSAKIDVTYMTTGGPIEQPQFVMAPKTRKSILVNGQVPANDTSIEVESDQEVIAERAMYWDNGTGKAGHDTVGVTAPRRVVYLAEGSTAWGFHTFLCIQNPNNEDTEVSITYMTDTGPVVAASREVKGNSRITVDVNKDLPGRDTSIMVQASVPIMAERAMYWNEGGAGHVSIGWMR